MRRSLAGSKGWSLMFYVGELVGAHPQLGSPARCLSGVIAVVHGRAVPPLASERPKP